VGSAGLEPATNGAVALLYLMRELFSLPIPVPALRKQVPEWWRTFYSTNVTAFLYGLGLGIGYATYLSYGTSIVVSLAAIASGDVVVGALICGAFGVARSVAVALGEPVERLDAISTSRLLPSVNSLVLCLLGATAIALLWS
jgi:uncharacterized membrane protein YesL